MIKITTILNYDADRISFFFPDEIFFAPSHTKHRSRRVIEETKEMAIIPHNYCVRAFQQIWRRHHYTASEDITTPLCLNNFQKISLYKWSIKIDYVYIYMCPCLLKLNQDKFIICIAIQLLYHYHYNDY